MTDKTDLPRRVSDRALEMLMRDVLDGMVEFTLDAAYSGTRMGFEILEIRPEHRSHLQSSQDRRAEPDVRSAEIIPFPLMQQAV